MLPSAKVAAPPPGWRFGRAALARRAAALTVVGCFLLHSLAVVPTQAAPGADDAHPAPEAAPEPVVIIDARRTSADLPLLAAGTVATNLGKIGGLTVVDGERATAGLGIGPRQAAARTALTKGRLARDSADCATAVGHARTAILALAAAEASGDSHDDELADAYGINLHCAASATAPMAQSALANLETLAARGARRASAILAARDHLVIDATANRPLVTLTIESQPAPADVWIDHKRIGRAPLSVHLPDGEHLIAVAVVDADGQRSPESHSTALYKVIEAPTAALAVALTPQPKTPLELAATTVASWQHQEDGIDVAAMTTLLAALATRFAVVIVDSGSSLAAGTDGVLLRVWGKASQNDKAQPLGEFRSSELLELGSFIQNRAALWDGRGPNPDLPVTVNVTENGMNQQTKEPQKWWVYASIIGAVLVGAAAVYASDAVDDRQKIELTWP